MIPTVANDRGLIPAFPLTFYLGKSSLGHSEIALSKHIFELYLEGEPREVNGPWR
jgi:hypothetical protein